MKVISKQITINITLVLYKVITIANKNFVIKNILVSTPKRNDNISWVLFLFIKQKSLKILFDALLGNKKTINNVKFLLKNHNRK